MKKNMIGIFALMAISAVLLVGAVSAYRGDYTTTGPNFDEERHELMEAAFDNADYDAWVELMESTGRTPRVLEVVNEDNFDTFVAAHEAGKGGDHELAAQLRSELGLGNGQGMRGQGRGMGMHQNSFVDADGDGSCDNLGQNSGIGQKGQGRNR